MEEEVADEVFVERIPQPVIGVPTEPAVVVGPVYVFSKLFQASDQTAAGPLALLALSFGSTPQLPVLIAPVLQLLTDSKPGSSVPEGDQYHVPVLV